MTTMTPDVTEAAAADTVTALPQNIEDISQYFTYDDTKLFNVEVIKEEVLPSGITVREISYDAYDKTINTSGKISAYVVMPAGDGPFPGILYFHWLGHFNSNKEEFLEEAKEMAGQGIAGVLIDGYFPWKAAPSELEKDKELVRYQVIEVRRALDYICSLPEIDKEHIGYVGHDYGAMFGTVAAGIDKRVSCYVLMTAMGNFTDWFIQYWPHTNKDGTALDEAGKNEYRAAMSEIDPVNFIKAAAPAKLFFQFADNDVFISKETAEELYEAASEPKEEKTYSAQHELESEEAKQDRINWLLDNLK
jgi:dienelactone hydrolase